MINLGGQYDFDSGAFGYNAGLGYTQGGQGPTGEIGSKQYFLNFHKPHRPNFQLPKLEIDKTITAAPQVSLSSEETRPLLTYKYLDYSNKPRHQPGFCCFYAYVYKYTLFTAFSFPSFTNHAFCLFSPIK